MWTLGIQNLEVNLFGFCCYLQDKTSLCSQTWPPTHDPPVFLFPSAEVIGMHCHAQPLQDTLAIFKFKGFYYLKSFSEFTDIF